jgi:enoyl-CoA hydratase
VSQGNVFAAEERRIGHLLLNRPKALNALDLRMIHQLTAALAAWHERPNIHAVVIESASDRAFCAGADIRAVRAHVLAGDADAVEQFFIHEYALNAAIADYPKPYVAVIDGICMGGGIGISTHGRIRVATEHAVFAMPETAIGMFPDIGATFFLPRLPGEIGLFLGLTGTRLAGADAVHAGLATHFVLRADMASLRAALREDGIAAVATHARALPPFSLRPHRATIDRCFGAGSVAEILERLRVENTDFARATLATLNAMSPSALCWSFAAIRRGAGLTLHASQAAELALTRQVTRHPDFAEGVRAVVVDKDRQPRWTPGALDQVDSSSIAAMLE